jgi:hypothetical protein
MPNHGAKLNAKAKAQMRASRGFIFILNSSGIRGFEARPRELPSSDWCGDRFGVKNPA